MKGSERDARTDPIQMCNSDYQTSEYSLFFSGISIHACANIPLPLLAEVNQLEADMDR